MRALELLAPARTADIGIAAIDCGADAVYIAGPGFGARQAAGNSMEDLQRLCEYAHLFGARIFLTLNTILYDNELEAAAGLLEEAREAGVDAVIAQDLAVFERLGSPQNGNIRKMPVHASTQCAIRTPEQARFYESLGADRLVLERQLSLDQIRSIKEAVGCELEFFVHGALCVCYSGQCYLSHAVAGRSANRGSCIQACRSLYDLVDSGGKVLVKDKALLSLKDLNLIARLGELADAGINSFKIEGRLKGLTYVRNVVKAYSQALDALVKARPEEYRRASFGRSEGGFIPDLAKTFNRGYTELFLDGKRGQWSSMDAPKSIGERIGTVVSRSSVEGRPALLEGAMRIVIRPDNPQIELHNGDGFCFVSKDHNRIVGFRGDVCQANVITCKEVPEIFVGAMLYRNSDAAFEHTLETNLPVRRIPVKVDLRIEDGTIEAKVCSEDGRTVTLEVETGTQVASNQDRMRELFHSQIGKSTGRYSFVLDHLETEGENGSLPFMQASSLNGIRREIASRLDALPCKAIPMPTCKPSGADPIIPHKVDYRANVSNSLAREAYRRLGANQIEDAFEVSGRKEAELMRTKYCIRHELGLCPSKRQTDRSLFLVNNGKRYRLGFDCARCEMTVSKA